MTTTELKDIIKKNLRDINTAIVRACERVGRAPAEVRLVAVTKYAELPWVEALATCHPVFGENRPQQLAERQPMFADAEWHLIGQLQRNKVRLAVQYATWIHSVDSMKLLERIAAVSRELKVRPRILLQVNVSGEESKSGFSASELLSIWKDVAEFQSDIEIAGLMTMAPAGDSDLARPVFRRLVNLRIELTDKSETTAARIQLRELSMGMSGDFEVAIEEGATLVRIGSRLYAGLNDRG